MKYTDLFEAKYDDAFISLLHVIETDAPPLLKSVNSEIETLIQKSKSVLKKEDRIIWCMKWARVAILNRIRNSLPDAKVGKLYRTYAKKLKTSPEALTTASMPDIQALGHFLSLDIEKIQKHIWSTETPEELISIFTKFEDEWKTSKEADQTLVSPEYNDVPIIEFDGNKAWWKLDRSSCSAEANAMGHCGNSADEKYGDRILSFRTKVTDDLWKPHLTFILDKNNYLGEMKGRGNEKPAKKYHPYIIALLKSDYVDGIKGGGYEPENNFSINDLETAEKERLLKLKPSLMSVKDAMNAYGFDKRFINVLNEYLYNVVNAYQLPIEHVSSDGIVDIKYWENIREFVEDIPDLRIIDLLNVVDGKPFGNIKPTLNDYVIVAERLPDAIKEKLLKAAESNDMSDAIDYLGRSKHPYFDILENSLTYKYSDDVREEALDHIHEYINRSNYGFPQQHEFVSVNYLNLANFENTRVELSISLKNLVYDIEYYDDYDYYEDLEWVYELQVTPWDELTNKGEYEIERGNTDSIYYDTAGKYWDNDEDQDTLILNITTKNDSETDLFGDKDVPHIQPTIDVPKTLDKIEKQIKATVGENLQKYIDFAKSS